MSETDNITDTNTDTDGQMTAHNSTDNNEPTIELETETMVNCQWIQNLLQILLVSLLLFEYLEEDLWELTMSSILLLDQNQIVLYM
jgi:hypothetical protein